MVPTGDVSVRLLGRPLVRFGRERVDFAPDMRFQLLAYLAYADAWVGRDRLALLFWPEHGTQVARRNLRSLLRRTRGLAWTGALETKRHGLRWHVPTDVAAFRDHLDHGRALEALALHAGPLLDGLDRYDGTGFGEWLDLERDRFHDHVRTLRLSHAASLADLGRYAEAMEVVRPLLDDVLDEEAVQVYLATAVRADASGEGLRAYDAFATRLARDMEMEPAAATRQRAAAIRSGDADALDRLGRPPMRTDAASFDAAAQHEQDASSGPEWIGRHHELEAITQLLERTDCRLLTLSGAGGVGKSRMAAELARRLAPRYPAGAIVVSCDAVDAPERVPERVAAALRLPLGGPLDVLDQVANRLGGGRALLALDDYDVSVAGTGVTLELLRRCPRLDLIVTARGRLNVPEEWLFPVHGLAYPSNPVCLSDALAFDAVRLFASRARRVRPEFVIAEADLPWVLDVCRQVGGFPLGIELAAAWVRVLSCQRIAKEIENDLDFLSSSRSGTSHRHDSLRATFEHSWRRLGDAERSAMRDLSVFRGGFTSEAATAVTGAPLSVVVGLVDASLVHRDASGRYAFHPLTRAFAREKARAEPDAGEEVRDRHARHFLQALRRRAEETAGAAPASLAADVQNVRAAWIRFVTMRDVRALAEAAEPFTLYFEAQARYQEGIDLLARALPELDVDESDERQALGTIAAGKAGLYRRMGRHDPAEECARQALSLLGPETKRSWATVRALETLGYVASFTGRTGDAEAHWREALAAARAGGDDARAVELIGLLGWVEAATGRHAQAEERARVAMDAIDSAVGDAGSTALTLTNVGSIHLATGKPRLAREAFLRGLRVARLRGDPRLVPQLLFALAEVEFALGAFARAQELCDEAIEQARRRDDRLLQCWLLALSGRAASAAGDHARAARQLAESAEHAWRIRNATAVLQALTYLAEAWLARGEVAQARSILRMIKQHPATGETQRMLLDRLWQASGGTQEGARDAEAEGPSLTLEEAMEQVLERTSRPA